MDLHYNRCFIFTCSSPNTLRYEKLSVDDKENVHFSKSKDYTVVQSICFSFITRPDQVYIKCKIFFYINFFPSRTASFKEQILFCNL